MKSRIDIYVRVEHEVRVRLPVPIPKDDFDDEGQLKTSSRYRRAAVNAAVSFLPQHGEIDVSGDLPITFRTIDTPEGESSMAKVSVDCGDGDVVEVRCEES